MAYLNHTKLNRFLSFLHKILQFLFPNNDNVSQGSNPSYFLTFGAKAFE